MRTRCDSYFDDLNTMHDRFEAVKKMLIENEHLLGNFSAQFISRISAMENDLEKVTLDTSGYMSKIESLSGNFVLLITLLTVRFRYSFPKK